MTPLPALRQAVVDRQKATDAERLRVETDHSRKTQWFCGAITSERLAQSALVDALEKRIAELEKAQADLLDIAAAKGFHTHGAGMKTSPTQRSLKFLRDQGLTAAVTERWNQWAGVRQDLFGFVDLVALDPLHRQVIFVQTTTSDNLAARRTKIEALPAFQTAKDAGCRVEIHGWAKRGGAGKRKLWSCRVEEM